MTLSFWILVVTYLSVGVVWCVRERELEKTYLWPTPPTMYPVSILSPFFLATRNQILFGAAMWHAQLTDYKHISLPFFPRLPRVQEWSYDLHLTDATSGEVQLVVTVQGGEGVYIGHNFREVFALLIKGGPYVVNKAILRPQGNKQEDKSQYAKNDGVEKA